MIRKKRSIFILVINLFIGITILALLAIAYLTLVRATITVAGEREEFKTTATVQAGSETVPVESLSRDYELSKNVPLSKKISTAKKAGGMVIIENHYTQNQSLVRTTRLLTSDQKLFRITQNVVVPAGGSVEVFAEADAEGDAFLVGPTNFTIPGLREALQKDIYAVSKAAMTYDRPAASVVTNDDLMAAEKVLREEIIAKAAVELARDNKLSYTIAPEFITLQKTTFTSEPAVGTEATSLKAILKATAVALAINPDDIKKAATDELKKQLPREDAFIETIDESLHYEVKTIDAEQKTATLAVTMSAWIQGSDVPNDFDKSKLVGKNLEYTKHFLLSQKINATEIKIWPSFIPIMPFLADHITVKVK